MHHCLVLIRDWDNPITRQSWTQLRDHQEESCGALRSHHSLHYSPTVRGHGKEGTQLCPVPAAAPARKISGKNWQMVTSSLSHTPAWSVKKYSSCLWCLKQSSEVHIWQSGSLLRLMFVFIWFVYTYSYQFTNWKWICRSKRQPSLLWSSCSHIYYKDWRKQGWKGSLKAISSILRPKVGWNSPHQIAGISSLTYLHTSQHAVCI